VTENTPPKSAPAQPGPWWTRRPAHLPPGRIRWLVFILILVVAFLGYDWFRLSSLSSYRYAGQGWKFPTRVFADWRDYRVGDRVDESSIQRALDRARYRRIWKRPTDPGQYRVRGATFEIYLRPFTYPDHVERGSEVVVEVRDGQIASLGEGFAEPGPRGLLRIDPETLAEFSDQARERRSYISLGSMPRHLVLAVIASEDRRFFRHWGLDLLGMGRATVRNVVAGAVVEGGSTISQQLVKNLFLSRERNVWRKFHEALLAVMVELRYSKEQILEFYLNQIYLGQRGSWSVCGVEEGSLYYFNKHVDEITPAEAALLVGIIPAPNKLSPYRDPDAALARRDQVLGDMVECGFISKQDAKKYRQTPLRFAANAPPTTRAPYFVDYVRELLSKDISESDLSARGFSIFTTLDGRMQEEAERIVRAGAREADVRSPIGGAQRSPAQASLVAIEPSTGYIRAMVGGRSYEESPYNRAVDSRRQPGSAFKPFVYAAALDTYYSGRRPPLTAATLLIDQPDTLQTNLGPWSPKNFENSYAGQVTVARAIARSLNVATVKLSQLVGMPKVIEMARTLGIESRLRQVASLALGTSELSVLELTTAYATLANGGVRMTPVGVKAVLDRGGNVRWSSRREGRRVIRPEIAYMTTILLEGPVIYGTAAALRSAYGFVRPAAGKTGTTDDENDAWFIGYTPDLAAGVWVGCDRNRRIGLTGTQAAVPIWGRFMQSALQDRPFRDFEAPQDVVDVWIDADTGYRAGPECPHVMRAAFIRKTEPRQMCPVMHPFWADSLPPDSTTYEEPKNPEEPNEEENQEPPAGPSQPEPSGDAGGAGTSTQPGH
jgi:1A family penicillin-binding protein